MKKNKEKNCIKNVIKNYMRVLKKECRNYGNEIKLYIE